MSRRHRTIRPRGVSEAEWGAAKRAVAYYQRVAPALRKKIETALRHDRFLNEFAAREAAFHLADWVYNLRDLQALYARKRWDPAAAQRVLMAFVAHAPAHLAAAHRILYGDPVTDVFEIGAVKGTGRARHEPGAHWREWSARQKRKKSRA
jgi:hypothetical protein